MFGGEEWIVVGIAFVLLFFGAKKIPEFARSLGMAMGEFKRGRMIVEREIEAELRASSANPVRKVKRVHVARPPDETLQTPKAS